MFDCENTAQINDLANELLAHIFRFLPAKDLYNCRKVCDRWKDLIKAFATEDDWKQFCALKFPTIYEEAKQKSQNLTWYEIYITLPLWSFINTSTENLQEIICDTKTIDSLFLDNGCIFVNATRKIYYYDTDLKIVKEESSRPVLKFLDYGDVRLTLNGRYDLYITKLWPDRPDYRRTYFCVSSIIVIQRNLYFVQDNKIIHCNLDGDRNYEPIIVRRPIVREKIEALGQQNGILHYLTENCVYAYDNKQFVKVLEFEFGSNFLDCIYRYNFETAHREINYFNILKDCLSVSLIGDASNGVISVMKCYGDTILLGTKSGRLLIYHKPFTNGILDLVNHDPIKNYVLVDLDGNDSSLNCVHSIDVSEMRDGHRVLVGLPLKVVVISLLHKDLV